MLSREESREVVVKPLRLLRLYSITCQRHQPQVNISLLCAEYSVHTTHYALHTTTNGVYALRSPTAFGTSKTQKYKKRHETTSCLFIYLRYKVLVTNRAIFNDFFIKTLWQAIFHKRHPIFAKYNHPSMVAYRPFAYHACS